MSSEHQHQWLRARLDWEDLRQVCRRQEEASRSSLAHCCLWCFVVKARVGAPQTSLPNPRPLPYGEAYSAEVIIGELAAVAALAPLLDGKPGPPWRCWPGESKERLDIRGRGSSTNPALVDASLLSSGIGAAVAWNDSFDSAAAAVEICLLAK